MLTCETSKRQQLSQPGLKEIVSVHANKQIRKIGGILQPAPSPVANALAPHLALLILLCTK